MIKSKSLLNNLCKIGFLFAMLFLIQSCKTTSEIAEVEKQEPAQLENALLWEISGKELSEPSYLFGTIHIIPAENYFLPNGTLSALESSDKVVFEIDMNDISDISKQMGLLTKAFMNDGKSLKDLLTVAEYKIVDDHFKKIGMPLFMLERMKPMFLTVFAYGDLDPTGLQSGSIKSYEMELFEIAENTKKEVGGLETIEFQMSVFDSIPYIEQAKMLVKTIESSDTGGDQFQEMIDMYVEQDINQMVTAISEEEGIGDYENLLLVKRNENWIPAMSDMMAKQPTFFAVGAGHLGGQKGVINLLREAGYTLKPLNKKE